MTLFDPQKLREDFPLIQTEATSNGLIYLDNAATTQKPTVVLRAIDRFYRQQNANVHRAAHRLSDIATTEYENARESVRQCLNARDKSEIIWTRGTTESINLLANCLALAPDDEIIISSLEHHANIVPWQIACQRSAARLRVIPLLANGDIDMPAFHEMLSSKTRLVTITHASNAIGTMPPITEIIAAAHQAGALVLIDGAQTVSHQRIDLQKMDCDFFACSGHKAFGPTGIGVLYGKRHLLDQLPPWQLGGEMITRVSFQNSQFQSAPHRFEAGTPNIAGALGFAAALKYLQGLDRDAVRQHEQRLVNHAIERCQYIKGLKIIGQPQVRAPLFSFVASGIDNKDLGTLLDQQGIAVRVGHHCAMPLMALLGQPGTLRASFSLYNTLEEVVFFCETLDQLVNNNVLISSVSALQAGNYGAGNGTPATDQPDFSAYGKSIKIEDICNQLLAQKEWQQRYRSIIKMGATLPKLPPSLKSTDTLVQGCESAVWLHEVYSPDKQQLYFMADSESRILRGLLCIILAQANHQTPAALLNFNPITLFESLGLNRHLSPSRSNGLHSIIEKIRALASMYQ